MSGMARRGRGVLLALGFCLGVAGISGALAWTLARAEIAVPAIQADLARKLSALQVKLEQHADSPVLQVVILGDSMLMLGKDAQPGTAIPDRLQVGLNRRLDRPASVKVRRVVNPGLGYTAFYFLAGRIASAGPDAVVIELNPLSLDRSWLTRGWARTDLVAWLGASRLPEALGLPLHRIGLSTDRLLWMVASVELGLDGLWSDVQRQQLRVAELGTLAQRTLATSTGANARQRFDASERGSAMRRNYMRGRHRPRLSAEGYLERYSHVLSGVEPDDVSMALLGAAVEHFVRAGIETIVYVTPINFEHMEQVGVWDAEGMASSLANAREAVLAAGGHFVDLHDSTTDEGFRDQSGHLTFAGPSSASQALAERLAPHVVPLLRSSGRRD